MRRLLTACVPALLLVAGACTSATQGSSELTPPDRVLATDAQGQLIRQSSLNNRATAVFAATPAKVWPAVLAAFADVGIEANYADQANGRYGARVYTFPRTLKGERIGSFFSCGSSLMGEFVDHGTVTAEIVMNLTAAPEGRTNASTFVTGTLRRNDGSASTPTDCVSTGRIEEKLRAAVERHLGAM